MNLFSIRATFAYRLEIKSFSNYQLKPKDMKIKFLAC
jgi:hypothetical protein